jgi:glycosyltransferase, group 2 family
VYIAYFILIFADSKRINHSSRIGLLSVWAVCIQFYSYGTGFLGAILRLFLSKKSPEELFPKLFFKNK